MSVHVFLIIICWMFCIVSEINVKVLILCLHVLPVLFVVIVEKSQSSGRTKG